MKKFLEYMNSKHRNIKFTFEHEFNTFSLLNVKICCENSKLTTSVYGNPTFSKVFTNFESFIPTVQKFGLVYNPFHNKINTLKQNFKLNGYPIQLIDRCIKQFLQKRFITKAIQDTVNKEQLLIVLPFLGIQLFLVRK